MSGTGPLPGPARPRRAVVAAAVVAATLWAYWPMLAHGLHSDDFLQVHANRELGLDGALRFLFFADYGDRQWVYWRPMWMATFWLLHGAFGQDPLGYQATSLLLHTGCSLLVFFVALRFGAAPLVAGGAAALFALHPSHSEAVLWFSAASNVIPAAALLLLGTADAFRFASGAAKARTLVRGFALAAASLLWKEAAYAFPLTLGAAWWFGRARGPLTRRDAVQALAVAAFGALVVLHYLLRNRTAGIDGSLHHVVVLLMANAANFVQQLLPLPGPGLAPLFVAVALGAVLFVLLRRRERFWLVAAVAAMFPYVFLTHGGRFAYFFHGPLSVLLALFAARLVRAERSPWRDAAAAAALLGLLFATPERLAPRIAAWGRETAAAERCVDALVAHGHATRDELWVDHVPGALVNGLQHALALRTGHLPSLHALQVHRRPPFLIHVDLSGNGPDAGSTVLQLDPATSTYRATTFAALCGGLHPVPVFTLCKKARRVVDDAAARALLASGAVDPAMEPLLHDELPHPLDASAHGEIVEVRTDLRNLGVTVRCEGPMLLVIAFPVPLDFATPPAAILVGGRPAPVLRTNLFFHAVLVPAGTHSVQLLPWMG